MARFLKLKQVKGALAHLANEILHKSAMLSKDQAGNTETFREVVYLTLTDQKGQQLYVGQLLFVTGDLSAGEQMHNEMTTYLDFQGKVLGKGKVHKSCAAMTGKGD